ncbi:MAG: thioredoxin family protein [Planctomycetaceae bacterium]
MRRHLLLFAILTVAACRFSRPCAAGKFNRVLNVGDKAPRWTKLLGIDGKRHSLSDLKDGKPVVVVFIANRCPTTTLYEKRIKSFVKTYSRKGVRFVAINGNRGPTETFAKMMQRAKTSGFAFPYLRDPDQETARAYGATHTPHFFLLDGKRKIAYMGAFDDNLKPEKVEDHYLRDAVDALLAGKAPEVTESRQVGCEIEYDKKPTR